MTTLLAGAIVVVLTVWLLVELVKVLGIYKIARAAFWLVIAAIFIVAPHATLYAIAITVASWAFLRVVGLYR